MCMSHSFVHIAPRSPHPSLPQDNEVLETFSYDTDCGYPCPLSAILRAHRYYQSHIELLGSLPSCTGRSQRQAEGDRSGRRAQQLKPAATFDSALGQQLCSSLGERPSFVICVRTCIAGVEAPML